jgi:polyferredoxin
MPHALLADAVLVVHAAVVLFVIGGLVFIVVGGWRGWAASAAPVFRIAHAFAIGIVVAQAWLGADCPLTTLESWLRLQASGEPYTRGFIAHWLQRLIFYDAPAWVFTLGYTLFAAAVAAAWWKFPPRRRRVAA